MGSRFRGNDGERAETTVDRVTVASPTQYFTKNTPDCHFSIELPDEIP
jgi:hypothetical protein